MKLEKQARRGLFPLVFRIPSLEWRGGAGRGAGQTAKEPDNNLSVLLNG